MQKFYVSDTLRKLTQEAKAVIGLSQCSVGYTNPSGRTTGDIPIAEGLDITGRLEGRRVHRLFLGATDATIGLRADVESCLFQGCGFDNVAFSGKLANVAFEHCTFAGWGDVLALFSQAALNDVSFHLCNFTRCNFAASEYVHTVFQGCEFKDCEFEDGMDGADFGGDCRVLDSVSWPQGQAPALAVPSLVYAPALALARA